jgi:hypothetical protein
VFLYWHTSLPYSTHKRRLRGGYAATCYGYYPPNIPGRLFKQKEISVGPGRVLLRITPQVFSPFDEGSDQGVPSSPLLITPVRQKRYDIYEKTIGSIWKQASEAFNKASKIVIIGYSFPSTDVRAIGLLRDALAGKPHSIDLEIVAPGVQEIVARIGKKTLSLAKTVSAYDETFDQYLGRLSSHIPERMRDAVAKDDKVRQWILRLLVLSLATAAQRSELHRGGI